MGYRKSKIAIRRRGDDGAYVDYVNGYEFDACFSNGVLFPVGVYRKTDKLWIVTDLNTGLFINCGKSRVDAVSRFQDSYLARFERKVFDNKHWSDHPSCYENWYEMKSSEFTEMVEAAS